MLRDLEMALEVADVEAFKNEQFKFFRIVGFVRERLSYHMQELRSSKHAVDYKFWWSNGITSSGADAGTLVSWDEPKFPGLLDSWLLVETRKQSKLLLQVLFSGISLAQDPEEESTSCRTDDEAWFVGLDQI